MANYYAARARQIENAPSKGIENKYTFRIEPVNKQAFEIYSNATTDRESRRQLDDPKDSGFDLYVLKDTTIVPGETAKIPLGIKCELLNNSGENCGYYLYARSSIYKTPLRLANCVGIIDSGYRGELCAVVDHVKLLNKEAYTIKSGTRLFQLCTPDLSYKYNVTVENKLSDTARGSGGFGSTGS